MHASEYSLQVCHAISLYFGLDCGYQLGSNFSNGSNFRGAQTPTSAYALNVYYTGVRVLLTVSLAAVLIGGFVLFRLARIIAVPLRAVARLSLQEIYPLRR